MSGTTDIVGAAFSVLVIVAWIPLAIFLLRSSRGRARDFIVTGWISVATAIFNGFVNVLRYTGRLADHATYMILNDSSMALYVIMVFLLLRAQRKSYPVA
jgi:hypothetical protein